MVAWFIVWELIPLVGLWASDGWTQWS